MYPLPEIVYVQGEQVAMNLAATLVRRGVVFYVEPRPEDEWEFRCKTEALPTVSEALAQQAVAAGVWEEA